MSIFTRNAFNHNFSPSDVLFALNFFREIVEGPQIVFSC